MTHSWDAAPHPAGTERQLSTGAVQKSAIERKRAQPPWSDARGWLTAIDAATGATRWRHQASKPMIGGVAATGGDVVFAGAMTGEFLVFDGKDGSVLYRHNVGGPIAGGVVSYAASGKQYVAVVSGFVGGFYNMMAPEIGGGNPSITVFSLKQGGRGN